MSHTQKMSKKIKNREMMYAEMLYRKVYVIAFFMFLCLGNFHVLHAQQVSASVDTTSIKIGEEIRLSIAVETDSSDYVQFPETKHFGALEMLESYKVDTTYEAAKYRLIKQYGLTQFDSGAYIIPPQTISINNRNFYTDSIPVEVRDVVVDTLKQKMYEIKPAVQVKSPPIAWGRVFSWLLPFLLLAAIIWYFLKRKKEKEAAKIQLPPYEEAIKALEALDSTPLLEQNKNKEYYSLLTEIIKRYLDREVDQTALESTSEELIERLMMHKHAGNFDFSSSTIERLHEIFKRADLVKFARMQQAIEQAKTDRKTVEEIINETHTIIPEPTEEALQEDLEYQIQQKAKQKKRRYVLTISGVFAALLLVVVIYGASTGFDNLKDTVLGNPLRKMAESEWVKSEYGYPSVVLETPDVLIRSEAETGSLEKKLLDTKDVFVFSDMKSPLYIMVSTFQMKEEGEIDLEIALDSVLDEMEREGAKNMLIQKDAFETDQGITGVKASGEFQLQVAKNRVLKNNSAYELFLFAQQGGLQEVLIVYQDDQKYARNIVERIISSIELEVTSRR